MIELKCPNCRANIELDDSREMGFCRYCGTKILIEPNKNKVDGIAGIDNLLLRAEQFLKEGNTYKAIEYFNKVLDIDIKNTKARAGLDKIKEISTNSAKTPFVDRLHEFDEKQKKQIEQKIPEQNLASKVVSCILNEIGMKHRNGIRHLSGYYGEYDNDSFISNTHGCRYRVGTLDSSIIISKIEQRLREEGFSKVVVKKEVMPNYRFIKSSNIFGMKKETKIPDGEIFLIYIEIDW